MLIGLLKFNMNWSDFSIILLGLLGPEVPLPQVALHVASSIINLGPGAVQALLQLGDARIDDIHCQAPVRAGRAALDAGLVGLGGFSGMG